MRRRTLALCVSAMIVCACSGGGAPALRSTVPSEEATEAAPQAASAPPAIPLEEDPVPAGAACESSSSCEDGQHCRGPAGCESEWACGPARECGESTVSYCGCEGLTFYALEGCPGQPHQHVGPCAALGEEITAEDVEEVEGNAICTSDADCRSGFVCAGAPGCGTFWTCVRRRTLRCARDRAPFCSCAGATFFSSSRCPGQPIAHAGYCAGDEPEAVASAQAAAAPPAGPAPAPPAEPAVAEARVEPPPAPPPTPPRWPPRAPSRRARLPRRRRSPPRAPSRRLLRASRSRPPRACRAATVPAVRSARASPGAGRVALRATARALRRRHAVLLRLRRRELPSVDDLPGAPASASRLLPARVTGSPRGRATRASGTSCGLASPRPPSATSSARRSIVVALGRVAKLRPRRGAGRARPPGIVRGRRGLWPRREIPVEVSCRVPS
ncbi:MAG: hypothetical protein M5U28_33410 [Sandaracinaceae bacterium]|nr:hypothetical protein [Sandaracinaceae bacterium]